MSPGLYSDPYLKKLTETKPKLAKAFFDSIATSEYVGEEAIISCLETPDWVLLKAGVEGCKNPNFPVAEFEKYLASDEVLTENIWSIFSYPNITKPHIDQLMKHSDINVQGLALAHQFGDQKKLLSFLQKVIKEENEDCYVLNAICRTANLNSEVFDYLVSVHEFESGSLTIGQALWENPTLIDLQRVRLIATNIRPNEGSEVNQDFCYISSIPFYQSLNACFDSYKGQKFATIPKMDPEIERAFTEYGHHYSVLLPGDMEAKIEVNELGLRDINSVDFLQRLFWTDLCQREDFSIYRRNAYRTDDLFIAHPILGRDFEETDAEESWILGGVLMFGSQKWLVGEEELPAERAALELGGYEGSLGTIVEEGNYDYLGQALIALTIESPELTTKYGFEVTEVGKEWMIAAAVEFAEPDSFDVSADLNPYFGEMLSYRKISDAKKLTLLNFLRVGYLSDDSRLRSDCIHFLGCMALSGATPDSILHQLKEIDHPLIRDVLKYRTKCINCHAEIGYGLCLKCNLGDSKSDLIYTDDEADDIYLRGLTLVRSGEKYDAMEVWLPLAKSGDATTIGAVIATLWLMDRIAEAKTWIVRLAEIDMDDLEALAERLDVPFGEFERYAAEGKIRK
jgi:hypothetical protein